MPTHSSFFPSRQLFAAALLSSFLLAPVGLVQAQGLFATPQPGEQTGAQSGSSGEAGQRWQQMDTDGDGRLSPEEAPARLRRAFDRVDTDGDGFITLQEIQAMRGRRGPSSGENQPQLQRGQSGDFPGRFAPVPASVTPSARDIPYSDAETADPTRLTLDIYNADDNAGESRRVMIMLHGGGWAAGDKGMGGVVNSKVPFFVEAGWIFVSANYRLVPEVGFGEQAADVAAAIVWVRDNIARYGGDAAQIFLMGHSAGAHLAALTATDDQYLLQAGADPSLIKGVVLLDGAAYDMTHSSHPTAGPGSRIYQRAFGTDPADLVAASPVSHAASGMAAPPFFIAYVDRPRAPEQSALLAEALAAGGVQSTTYLAPQGYDHNLINTAFGAPGDEVAAAVMAFLDAL